MAAHPVEILQLNSQHCQLASVNLKRILSYHSNYIALIQEPYAPFNKVANTPSNGCVLTGCSPTERPRACAFVGKSVAAWPMLDFSDRDTLTLSVTLNINKTDRTVWMVSSYMADDAETTAPPAIIRRIADHCTVNGIPLIISCDANAHHVTWGSTNTNRRGETLFEFLFGADIYVCNQGAEPTFVVANRSEILDLTLASVQVMNHVKNWRVDKTSSFSDHRIIRFEVGAINQENRTFRNVRKIDKESFERNFNEHINEVILPDITGREELDQANAKIAEVLTVAFEESCPEQAASDRCGDHCWWTRDLTMLRKTARRQYKKAYRSGSPDEWASYRAANRKFKKEVRTAKRLSWQRHCESMTAMTAMAKAVKMLRRDKTCQLGPIKCTDGSFTTSPAETLKEMLSKHYPDCTNATSIIDSASSRQVTEPERNLIASIVEKQKVEYAISQFSPYKSPGPDKIYPVMLQLVTDRLSGILSPFYKACLLLGYVPKGMRESRVVFIPKPGKNSYNESGSFRPITLTSFLLKTLERLILWHLQGDANRLDRQSNQYAYKAGCSTVTALHTLVSEIEKSVFNQKFALCAFMDIKGAFSHLYHDSIVQSLKSCKLPWFLVKFIEFLLKNQIIIASLSGCSIKRQATRGCPQGGVLSPKLFTPVVDELLKEFNHGPVQIQAFADDICAVTRGHDVNTLRDVLQTAIDKMVIWSSGCGLDFAVEKTVVVNFTKKLKWTLNTPLILKNRPLVLSKQVRYLGVHLDSKLSWIPEIKSRSRKGKQILVQCKRIVGKYWGASPLMCKWIYTAIVRPLLSYAVLIWGPGLSTCTGRQELTKVQRLALLCITSAYPGTPTAVMETLLNISPITYFLLGEGVAAMQRLIKAGNWDSEYEKGTLAHPGHAYFMTDYFNRIPVLKFPNDRSISCLSFYKKFNINVPDRTIIGGIIQDMETSNTLICYTDGSKLETGRTGAGVVFHNNENELVIHEKECILPLGSLSTVFQAEIMGIQRACELLLAKGVENRSIAICSDSQSAIKALNKPQQVATTVINCAQKLNELGTRNNLSLYWVPGHASIPGNERADERARAASSMVTAGPEPTLPVATASMRLEIRNWVRMGHDEEWRQRTDCRLSRLSLPQVDSRVAKAAIKASRRSLRKILQVISGHCNLALHRFKTGIANSAICPKCGIDNESVAHFIASCPFYRNLRTRIFGRHAMEEPPALTPKTIKPLTRYVEASGRLDEFI